MASSNRHWPSMFKSKPFSNNNHPQWQQHLEQNPNSLLPSGCHIPPFTSGPVCEERIPEPKPRWNPKPEQIHILESIFNSGIINPPRDEIRKIRAQLEEYGQITDANVFYWFQNRKSRSKNKLRPPKKPSTPPQSKVAMEMTNSPSASVNNNNAYVQTPALAEPYVFPAVDGNMLMMNNNYNNTTTIDATAVSSGSCANTVTTTSVPSTISHFLGVGVGDYHSLRQTKSTVFINDVAFEVNVGPFNVRNTFGDDAMLVQSNGHAVFTDEWGVTVQSLQHGGYYYLMRMLAPVAGSETQPI